MTPASTSRSTLARRAAIGASVLFGLVAAFQLALSLGAPWGRAAYGGLVEQPGQELRISSVVATVVWASAALIVLRRAGHSVWAPLPRRALPAAVWFFAGLTTLGMVMNAISPSQLERVIWVPTTFAMAALTLTVALASRREVAASSPASSE